MMHAPVAVIKYGGRAMRDPALSESFVAGLASLGAQGMRFVVVHGGGPQIGEMLNALHIENRFEQGLRVTDKAVMQVVEMVLCGQVNKAVVSLCLRHGVRAAGISGKDGGLLTAGPLRKELGLVGKIRHVDPALLLALLNAAFVPVVAPVAADEQGKSYNINADTAAGALAGALQADYFVLISDVPGVVDKQGDLIASLQRCDVARLTKAGTVSGGMIPKLESCLQALDAGCRRALILDGRAPASFERYLTEGAPLGTAVKE